MRARLALAVAGLPVELREVVLRDKPPELLNASPKATVPVLVLADQVIEESYDIMLWALAKADPEGWLLGRDDALISEIDGPFKTALDAYKYGKSGTEDARGAASETLFKLEAALKTQPFLSGPEFTLADAASITFIRQFAYVDIAWFNAKPWPHLRAWLENFLASPRFAAIMQKYPKWQAEAPATLFPEPQ
jgi:glutathione S-transferase